jgi:predicted HTH transcriptional regulator
MIKKLLGFLLSFLTIFYVLKLLRESNNSVSSKKEALKKNRVEKQKEKEEEFDINTVIKENRENLNERQVEILKLYKRRLVLLPSDIYGLHPQVSTRTLRRDMSNLVDLGLVIQEGTTKDTRYLLNK